MEKTPVLERNTPRGTLRVATPEATALELVGYDDRCSGLSNVATVLSELAERIGSEALVGEAGRAPVSWVQRLGYLLELVGKSELAAPLLPFVSSVEEDAPLVRSLPRKGAPRDRRWRLVLNATVEPDL